MTELAVLTLMVWNVHGLPFPCITGGADAKEVRRFLSAQQYDALFTQEVWTKKMYRAVKKGAGMLYRTRVSKAGLAIVARRDLMEDHQFHEFKYTTLSKWDFLSSKGFQTFTAMVAEDTEVMFINTHLDSGKDRDSLAARLTQIAHIVEVASEFEGPIVLVGDLNLNVNREGDSYLLGKLMDDLDLTIAVKDRFDYILVSRGIYVLGTEVILKEVNPSDHAALLVTLEFN